MSEGVWIQRLRCNFNYQSPLVADFGECKYEPTCHSCCLHFFLNIQYLPAWEAKY